MQLRPYLVIALGCALASTVMADARSEAIVCGPAVLVGNGAAWTWAKLDSRGMPTSVGVTLTETALSGLPTSAHGMKMMHGTPVQEYLLELPKEIRGMPYDHVGLDWNPMGHVPQQLYGVAHWDVHFYTISQADRMAITAEGEDLDRCKKAPDPSFVPASYILPPDTIVPQMGAHWIDPSTPELSGKPFTATLIYGSYNGKTAFFEPMVAASFLLSKPNFSSDVKPMKAFDKDGFYPSKYSIVYNADRREYTVSLDNLSMQKSSASK